jgi:site-specific DNA recombinase
LYARVSGDDRRKEDRNLKGQIEMARDYCQKQGYQIVAELQEDDRGTSGAAFELPQLSQAIEMAWAGEFDVLVVRELDRLARSLPKQLFVEDEFRRAGARVEYVLHKFPDTPEGNLMKNVGASIAEYERLKIAERTRRGRRRKVKSGHVSVGKQPPYGYTTATGEDGKATLEVNEDEAATIRMIFDLYTGPERMSMRAIAQHLTQLGIPTWTDLRRPGKGKKQARGKWSNSSVRPILANETYTGRWLFGKRKLVITYENGIKKQTHVSNPDEHLIAVDVPAIVDRATWKIAQHRRDENRRNSTRKPKHPYLLRQRLACTCGLKIGCQTKHSGGKIFQYYCCPAIDHFRYSHRPCDLPYFRADHVDAVVWEWLKTRFTPEKLDRGLDVYQAERDQENAPIRAELENVDKALEENRAKLERLLDLYLDGEFDKNTLAERKRGLERAIANLERARAGLLVRLEDRVLTREQIRSLQEFATEFSQGFDLADQDFATRRRVIEAVDAQATLAVEDGEKVMHVSCVLGKEALQLATSIS